MAGANAPFEIAKKAVVGTHIQAAIAHLLTNLDGARRRIFDIGQRWHQRRIVVSISFDHRSYWD
jgi:hypothetical protein